MAIVLKVNRKYYRYPVKLPTCVISVPVQTHHPIKGCMFGVQADTTGSFTLVSYPPILPGLQSGG